MIKAFRIDRDFVKLPYGPDARAIIWPGVGAKHGTFNYFTLQPGESVPAHVHPYSEDLVYIVKGKALLIDEDKGKEYTAEPGWVFLIEPGTKHSARAVGNEPYVDVGGPCPPDVEFLRRAGLKW